jgi:hypothetical protein
VEMVIVVGFDATRIIDGYSILWTCGSKPEIYKMLIDSGADVNYVGRAPCKEEKIEDKIYKIIENFEDISSEVQKNVSKINNLEERRQQLRKIIRDHPSLLSKIGSKGCLNYFRGGNTILFHQYCPKIVRVLLDAGADVNHINDYGQNVLFGPWPKNAEVIQMLLDAGANVHHTDIEGKTILKYHFLESESYLLLINARAAKPIQK